MGGRLRQYTLFWEESLRAPPHIVNILKGYLIPLNHLPPLSLPRMKEIPMSKEKKEVIDSEIKALLGKGAIRKANPLTPGFQSNILVVPKKDGGWRPIINLKPLNRSYITAPHFRMDTVKDVAALLRPGDWAISIDLKDAYFHVLVHKKFHHLLRFAWRGILYKFVVLPFGLCTAPFIFTKITKPLAAFLRAKGIRLIFYLDDILVIASSMEECLRLRDLALDTLQRAGFIINWKKSSLIPAQRFLFLGLWWNTTEKVVALEERKLLSLQTTAEKLLKAPISSCQSVMKLLGLMSAAIPAVPLIRLHSRSLQVALHSVYKTSSDLRRPLSLPLSARRELAWVLNLSLEDCQAPIWKPCLEQADLKVATDSSDVAWGIYFQGRMEKGCWDATAPLHINAKEITVLLIFLKVFLPQVDRQVSTLLWETDSSTALSYIAKEGGTRSPVLLKIAEEILLLAEALSLRIVPVFVPSEQNLHADFASRFKALPDLHLLPRVFRRICHRWGLPQIDLFASTESAQLPRFLAWGDAPTAEAFDALSIPWEFQLAYLFPPIPLIPRVLSKMRQSKGTFILITPFWTNQSWFPLLLQLEVLEVLRLPLLPDLVVDLQTGTPPRMLNSLHLVAWKILSRPMVSQTSEIPPLSSSSQVGELLPTTATTAPGPASSSSWIPEEFRLLPPL